MSSDPACKMLGRRDTEELFQTEEDFQRELEIAVLRQMRNYLCNHLEPERFFPFLQTKEYLDSESCEEIRSAGTTRSRVNKMLDILIKSGPQPLRALTKAIERSGRTQRFVTKKLDDEYTRLRNAPSNIERLHAIQCRGPPPPYSTTYPYNSRVPDASTFHLSNSDANSKLPYASTTVVTNHLPGTNAWTPCNNVGPLTMVSDRSQYTVDASVFRSDDFSGNGSAALESINDQYNAERKISLLNTNTQWTSNRRTPSEHDATEENTSPSNTNINSTSECGSTTPDILLPPQVTGAPPSYTLSTRPRDFRSYPSYANGSIQASVFTSSNFGAVDHSQSVLTYPNSTEMLKPKFTLGSANQKSSGGGTAPGTPGTASRQFSATLEPIQSIDDVPSVDTDDQQSSISIRRPPIEHDDASITTRNLSDESMSSLEISTESPVAEVK